MVSSRSPGFGGEGLQENGNVLGINNGGASSPGFSGSQTSSSAWSRSEPSSLRPSRAVADSGPYSASPEHISTSSNGSIAGNGLAGGLPQISSLAPGDEERFEAFGATDDANSPQGSGSPDASPTACINSVRNPRSPNSMLLGRHSWLRTSLGRTPAGANRKRLSSNALASQLYRSSSFNSSGRGSICDTADEVYSDVSLEEDVIDLNHRVQMIQEQMHVLVDTQSAGEERYARVKQENATLQARILMLEEAARDAESRAEDKLETEQRRHRDWANRLEREKELQLENLTIKLQAAEIESSRSRDEVAKLHDQLGKFRAEMSRLEGILEETRLEVQRTREAERRAALGLVEINRKLQRAEEELAHRINAEHRIEEMVQEMENLRTRNKNLEESRDELQAAAAALQAGRELLMPAGQDPNDNKISRTNSPSLATELLLTGSTKDQADGINTGICRAGDICDNNITTLAEVWLISQDDKAKVLLGMTAAKGQAPILMHLEYKIRLPDHDWIVGSRHKLIPSVYAGIVIKENCLGKREAVTHSGPTYIAIRSGKHSSSTASTHARDLDKIIELDAFKSLIRQDDGRLKPVLMLSVDGGPDENPRYKKVIAHAIDTFKKYNLDAVFIFTNAPGRSAFNRVERRMAPLSRVLSGVILPHSQYGNHLDGNGKTIDLDLEIKNFQFAGEARAQIWSDINIDDHSVTAEVIPSGEIFPECELKRDSWYSNHVRESQYLLQALQALKDQREVNTRLRSYIDGILLNIVENYPQLLEVKQPH